MATNPRIPQGKLNRIKGTVSVIDSPSLNITASFLGKGGITVGFGGDVTTMLPAMTGQVLSGEPYQPVTITIELLKTQILANSYKQRVETNSELGDVVVSTDSTTLEKYTFSNCAIVGVDDISANGTDAAYRIRIGGTYFTNDNLWA